MRLVNADGQRICQVCKKPFEDRGTRWDRKTCSSKCRQQLHRNNIREAEEERYRQARATREALQDRADKRNAARRKKRKATGRRGMIKP